MKSVKMIAAAALAATALSSTGAIADDYGPWQVRFRGVVVAPETDTSVSVGGEIHHSDQIIPEVDISYFFNENVSVEVIAGVTRHHGKAYGVTGVGTVDLGNVTLLPPTVTLQYHLAPGQMVNPYVGAGINYTFFFDESVPAGGVLSGIDHDNKFGWALQGGVDIKFIEDSDWFLNIDVKKIFLSTNAHLEVGGAPFVTEEDVKLDPWLFGVGFGRRF